MHYCVYMPVSYSSVPFGSLSHLVLFCTLLLVVFTAVNLNLGPVSESGFSENSYFVVI